MKIRLHPFLLPSTRGCTCTAENLWKWRLLHSLLFSAGFKPRNQIQREASVPLCQTFSTSFTFSHTELFTGRQLSVSGWICSGLAVLSLPLVANQKHVPRTLRGHFFPSLPFYFHCDRKKGEIRRKPHNISLGALMAEGGQKGQDTERRIRIVKQLPDRAGETHGLVFKAKL